jgi:hypothetical protein
MVIADDISVVRDTIKHSVGLLGNSSVQPPSRLVRSKECPELTRLVKVLGTADLSAILNQDVAANRHVFVIQKTVNGPSWIVPCSWWIINDLTKVSKIISLIDSIKQIDFCELYRQGSIVVRDQLVADLSTPDIPIQNILLEEFEHYCFIPQLTSSTIDIEHNNNELKISICSPTMLEKEAREWLLNACMIKFAGAPSTPGILIELPFSTSFLGCDIIRFITKSEKLANIDQITVHGQNIFIWFSEQVRLAIQEYRMYDFPNQDFSEMARKFIATL